MFLSWQIKGSLGGAYSSAVVLRTVDKDQQESMMKRKPMEEGSKESAALHEEEVEINTFFTLVRNIREARNQLLMSQEEEKGKEIKSSWSPSFICQDFVQNDVQSTNNTVMLPPSPSRNEEHCKAERPEELDLNLSL